MGTHWLKNASLTLEESRLALMAFLLTIPVVFALRNVQWNKIFMEILCQRNAFQNALLLHTTKITQQCFALQSVHLIQITLPIWSQNLVSLSVQPKDGPMTLKGSVLLIAPTILLLKTQHGDACLNVWEVLWLLPIQPHWDVFRNALLVGLPITLLSHASKNALKLTTHSLKTLQEIVSRTVLQVHMHKTLREYV